MHLWEMPTGKLVGTLEGHEGGLKDLRFSADSRCIVTACEDDGTARVWKADRGHLLVTVRVDKWPQSAQLSPDGQRLITASDADLQLWDANNGRLLGSLRRGKLKRRGSVRFHFSPDSQRVAVTDQKMAYVWETDRGNAVAIFEGHHDHVEQAEFSPDGQKLVTTSHDQTVRIWELLGTTVPPPAWFADFLQLMARRRFDEDGELTMFSTDEFLALRAKLEPVVNAERSRYAAVARWFLSPISERAQRPGPQ